MFNDTHPVLQSIKRIQQGEFVLVKDDEDRENEADLIIAAHFATPEKIGFMLRYSSGILCISLPQKRLSELKLPPMVQNNNDPKQTAFTVSCDLASEITTGISAKDRSKTLQALVDPSYKAEDFCRPGHIFPLEAREGGVLKRAGHTEAACDLTKLAGVPVGGVLAELTNDLGEPMNGEEITAFAKEHNIPCLTIKDLIAYRRETEQLVEEVSQAPIPTAFGTFQLHVFQSRLDGTEHLALVKGSPREEASTLVRVHSECMTGDLFGSHRCDCGEQLKKAMQLIEEEGSGVIVYLRGHEGRGVGLRHKLQAYQLQDKGFDTVEANLALGLPIDSREYGIGAQILAELGVKRLRLLTNNPQKYNGIRGFGLNVEERVPLLTMPKHEAKNYLHTKKTKLGHIL